MINTVLIEGNITDAPDYKVLDNEKKTRIANFSLACNKGRDLPAEFYNITAYNDLADIAQKLSKGSHICVEGMLKTETWTDKTTSVKRTAVVIVCSRLHYLSAKKKESEAPES